MFIAEVVDVDTWSVNSNCLYFYHLLVETYCDSLY